MLPPQVRATLKWPNNILANHGKIAGILVEQADDALILGVGVNVLQEPNRVSYKVSTIVGCGGLAAVDDTRARLLTALAERLDVWQRDGFAPVRTAWLAARIRRDRRIRISVGDRAIVGRFTDLAHDGALVVETADGPVRVIAGDVVLMPRLDQHPRQRSHGAARDRPFRRHGRLTGTVRSAGPPAGRHGVRATNFAEKLSQLRHRPHVRRSHSPEASMVETIPTAPEQKGR